MKQSKVHYSLEEKAEILIANSPCGMLKDAKEMANIIDRYTFDMLKGLTKALQIIGKGKLSNR